MQSLINKLNEALNEIETQLANPTDVPIESAPEPTPTVPTLDSQKIAIKIKHDANEYADGVLSRLQLLTTKLQTNIIKIENL